MSSYQYLAFIQTIETLKMYPMCFMQARFDFESHTADLKRAIDLCLERELTFKVSGSIIWIKI